MVTESRMSDLPKSCKAKLQRSGHAHRDHQNKYLKPSQLVQACDAPCHSLAFDRAGHSMLEQQSDGGDDYQQLDQGERGGGCFFHHNK